MNLAVSRNVLAVEKEKTKKKPEKFVKLKTRLTCRKFQKTAESFGPCQPAKSAQTDLARYVLLTVDILSDIKNATK